MELHLPPDVVLVRTTEVFDEQQHPPGLRRAHRVAEGVWGRLVVRTGALGFVFDDDPDHPRRVVAGAHQVIPPGRLHHIEFDGRVSFVIEFHRI